MRAVITYGAAGPRIASEVEGSDLVQGDFRGVLDAARGAAQSGDVILLSPACSSFDMFESYEDRGRRFSEFAREAV
jgi:UDP-N-acetylmuramoylalanine--D-glutamate ligase